MEGVPDFDIGGGQKLVETEDINDEDLLQWVFKDELQNIEVVELNVASLNPQPEAPKVRKSRWRPGLLMWETNCNPWFLYLPMKRKDSRLWQMKNLKISKTVDRLNQQNGIQNGESKFFKVSKIILYYSENKLSTFQNFIFISCKYLS